MENITQLLSGTLPTFVGLWDQASSVLSDGNVIATLLGMGLALWVVRQLLDLAFPLCVTALGLYGAAVLMRDGGSGRIGGETGVAFAGSILILFGVMTILCTRAGREFAIGGLKSSHAAHGGRLFAFLTVMSNWISCALLLGDFGSSMSDGMLFSAALTLCVGSTAFLAGILGRGAFHPMIVVAPIWLTVYASVHASAAAGWMTALLGPVLAAITTVLSFVLFAYRECSWADLLLSVRRTLGVKA